MIRIAKFALSSITALSLLSVSSCAKASQSSPVNTADREAIEKVIYQYLMKNPQIIREALIELQEREDRESILAVTKELQHDSRDFSIGPQNAKVTIVEFFDYNCTYCKKSAGWVQQTIEKNPTDIRFVFKELPILDRRTQTSRKAAIAALAAKRQNKYMEMHFALMQADGFSDVQINATAKKLGLTMRKFEKDLKDEKLQEHIEDNMYLASRIPGLTGTPFFIINEKFIASGNTVALQGMVDDAFQGDG